MDTEIFRRFLAVVECGSLNKAASKLNVSQPALSKSIHQLEALYDVPLLHRSPTGISATSYGSFLADRFKLLHNELVQVQEEMRALSTGASRQLMVGSPPGLGYMNRLLVNATSKLCSGKNPLSIDVRIGSRANLLPLLETGEIDLLIAEISDTPQSAHLKEEVLFSDQHILAMRQGHPLAHLDDIGLADLMAYPWAIGRDSEEVARQFLAASSARSVRREVFSTIRSDSSLYISSTVANSDFIGIVTTDTLELGVLTETFRKFWVRQEADTPRQIQRRIGVIYRSHEALNFAGRAMLRELRQAAGQHLPHADSV